MESQNKSPSKLKHQALPRVLRKDEIVKLLSCCDSVELVIMEFYLRTGLRASEGLRVKVKDINFDEQSVFVLKGKRNKDRVVPFDHVLKGILQKYILEYGLGPEDCLFCVKKFRGSVIRHDRHYKRTGSHYSTTQLYYLVRELAVKAGIQDSEPIVSTNPCRQRAYRVHPHLLRHTALTMIQESCGDPFITKEIAGHSSIAMTEIYVHLAIGRKRAAVEEAFKVIDTPAS